VAKARRTAESLRRRAAGRAGAERGDPPGVGQVCPRKRPPIGPLRAHTPDPMGCQPLGKGGLG
jgi:hypothetical protein